jgi:hypothetical protein
VLLQGQVPEDDYVSECLLRDAQGVDVAEDALQDGVLLGHLELTFGRRAAVLRIEGGRAKLDLGEPVERLEPWEEG